jgi:hypothetical protein
MSDAAREYALETWGEDWTPNEWVHLVKFADIYHARARLALADIIRLAADFPDGAPDHEFDNGYIAGVLAAVAIAQDALAVASASQTAVQEPKP